jgi:hypothetical protein
MKNKNTKPNPLTPLLPQLRARGVFKVEIKYSGSGDDGAIESIESTNKSDNAVEIGKELEEAIRTAVYDLLEAEYSGWEISDGEAHGSDGTITLTFNNESCTMEWCHNAHSTNSYKHEESL